MLNPGLLPLLSHHGALSTGEQEPPSKVKSLLLAVVILEYMHCSLRARRISVGAKI